MQGHGGVPLAAAYQNKVSDFFLVKFGGGRWSAFERVASVAKHIEDSFIVGIGQSRFWQVWTAGCMRLHTP